MGAHLRRGEGLAHQRRIRDHRLDTGLRHQAVHQAEDRVLVPGIIDQHEGVRTREYLLYL